MLLFPPCKINLGLFVTGKRADGFHSIESVFVPVPWTDVLEVITAPEGTMEFTVTGLEVTGDPEQNLCVRAFRLMQQRYGIGGMRAHLHKVLPMGAGLGGGSSDAASMLKALDALYRLGLPASTLRSLAAELGSDCPFFIDEAPAFVSGRGEVMEVLPLDLRGLHFTIIHPGIHMGTAEAYRLLTPRPARSDLRQLPEWPRTEWRKHLSNDFEGPVSAVHPVIAEIRDALYKAGAFYAAMSGSGSAVYALSEKALDIRTSDPWKIGAGVW